MKSTSKKVISTFQLEAETTAFDMPRSKRLRSVLERSFNDDKGHDYCGHCPSCEGSQNVDSETIALLSKSAHDKSRSCYIPARFVLAFLSFMAFVNTFTLRMDMNIAILDMVATHNKSLQAGDGANMGYNETATFPWSTGQQDMVLSAFYYGYCSTQILGGLLSGYFGGKIIFGMGLLVTSLVALLTPIAAMQSYYLLVACRVVQGLAQGLAQPCMHTMWSNWAPLKERGTLMAITYSGCQLGTVVATIATGYMCNSDVLGGWPLVFYTYGGAGLLVSVSWLLLVYDKPSQHPRISEEERRYIEDNIEHNLMPIDQRPPWLRVLRSPALLAIVAAHFATDWGCFALTTCLPSYMEHILKYDITENGFLSSLPFIVILVVNPTAGVIADKLLRRNLLSTKNTRKLLNSLGLLVPAILMLLVCFLDTERTSVVALLTLAVGFSGFTMAGYSVNHLDIAPAFPGLLYGVTNTIGTTTGFIGPAILAALTDHEENKHQWTIFFYLTAAIFFFGGLMFLLFAQGSPQSWGLPNMAIVNQEINVPQPEVGAAYGGEENNGGEYSIQDELSEDDIKTKGEDTASYDDVDWESLLASRRCEAENRHVVASSFTQVLQSY